MHVGWCDILTIIRVSATVEKIVKKIKTGYIFFHAPLRV